MTAISRSNAERVVPVPPVCLTDNPALARSIAHRFPCIALFDYLQVELLRRWRAGQVDEKAQRGILISIAPIAAALRNTG